MASISSTQQNPVKNDVDNVLEHFGWRRVPKIVEGALHPIERSSIARFADCVGYIPVVGSAVGILRIVSSVAIGVLTSLGAVLTALVKSIVDLAAYGELRDFGDWTKNCGFIVTRSVDEFVRGWIEIIPFAARCSDKARENREQQGEITDFRGAYGQYMYQTPPDAGFICYSQNKHEGQVQWRRRFECGGTSGGCVGAYGQIVNPSKELA